MMTGTEPGTLLKSSLEETHMAHAQPHNQAPASKAASKNKSQATEPRRAIHGTFIWNELMTHDPEKAKSFYKKAMGWHYEPMPMAEGSTYWIIKIGDATAGGIFPMVGPHFEKMTDQWVSYICVDDVDARVKQAVGAGAHVMREPFDIPKVGRIAYLMEPGGARICWMTPSP
jgi:uncharacterized protein